VGVTKAQASSKETVARSKRTRFTPIKTGQPGPPRMVPSNPSRSSLITFTFIHQCLDSCGLGGLA
jgi:hypothetical protein